jgi:hypothetical protein
MREAILCSVLSAIREDGKGEKLVFHIPSALVLWVHIHEWSLFYVASWNLTLTHPDAPRGGCTYPQCRKMLGSGGPEMGEHLLLPWGWGV